MDEQKPGQMAVTISMGQAYNKDIRSIVLQFRENVVTGFDLFDERNLVHCQYLNLRGSSFTEFKSEHLTELLYVDISAS